MKKFETIRQVISFMLVSCAVTILQLVLVNLFLYLMQGWKQPLPDWLGRFMNVGTVGAGNDNWGYVLPFFLSNVLANVYGYFRNRKTTFHSDAPRRSFRIYLVLISVLMLVSTWFQGTAAHRIAVRFPLVPAASAAAFLAGLLQWLILFPTEKYILFRPRQNT
ncbi:MAG: hypothetical protein IKE06_11180 [Solobacterium sp.]|nr:hypothetical protein [Solobacterium sp.]